jgi:transcriptional regulator with XRE-family HTH domain
VKPINDAAYARFLARLRSARQQARISQEYLAEQLQKHQTFVSKVENGERLLDLLEYLRWAREIGVDPMDLLRPLADEVQARRRPRKRTLLKGGGT